MHQAGERIGSNLERSGALLRSALLAALLAAVVPAGQAGAQQLQMKRVMFLTRSADDFDEEEYHPIGDFDGDGLLEMAYDTGNGDSMSTDPERWEIGRFLPFNRWQLLHADTVVYPPPKGIQPGYFIPGAFGAGGLYGPRLPELLGWDFYWDYGDSTNMALLCTREDRFSGDLPFTLAWDTEAGMGGAITGPAYLPGSLNFDKSRTDVPCRFFIDSSIPAIIQNTGGNRYRTLWTWPEWSMTEDELGFGDFNLDSVTEIVGALSDWRGLVRLWEATNDRNWALTWHDSLALPNAAHQIFTGHDPYQGGKPEFFVGPFRYEGSEYWECYLYRYEATGRNTYARTPVDSCARLAMQPEGVSMCADLCGDGVEEIVWNTGRSLEVYRPLPNGRFEHVYSWWNDHRTDDEAGGNVNIADVNADGYNEIVFGGNYKTSVLEVEAVRVLSPNGGETLRAGDTCRISWLTFNPPRCDSISLFLRRDSTYRLDTIATGLAPGDTPYCWVVPDIRADSCRIMAMAYGPGRQYDESDRTFQIQSSGIAEGPGSQVVSPELGVAPNPVAGRMQVSYAVPRAGPVRLAVFDGSGRAVKSFTGNAQPGRHELAWNCRDADGRSLAPGIYFLRLSSAGVQRTAKLVITGGER